MGQEGNRSAPNTMFPADWSRERIIEEIDSAWKKQSPNLVDDKWTGKSKSGVTIEGYKYPKPTAYPLHKKGTQNEN